MDSISPCWSAPLWMMCRKSIWRRSTSIGKSPVKKIFSWRKQAVPAIALTYSRRISLSRPIWASQIPTAPPVPMVLPIPTAPPVPMALPVPMVHQGVHPLLYMAVQDILLPKSLWIFKPISRPALSKRAFPA